MNMSGTTSARAVWCAMLLECSIWRSLAAMRDEVACDHDPVGAGPKNKVG
jgi:hypothetical protein